MKKIETIWHHILFKALEGTYKHTQQDLAREYSYSLSTIHHALIVPTRMGAIRKTGKFFVLQDVEKLLYYWASVRNIEKDILYATYYPDSIYQAETELPAKTIYGGYSAARRLLKEAPTDYDKLYCYFKDIEYFKKRFPENKENSPNVFILNPPDSMARYGGITTLPQTFVDVWNLSDWYARDVAKALEEKIHGLLS